MTTSKFTKMKKEVFIIDDDPIYCMIASKMIQKADPSVEICECNNGEEGLAELKTRYGADHKIVVLLDINMPVMDGWTFLEEIQKNNFYNLSHLAIYMVSSSVDKSDKLKAKNYEIIKHFYHKPLSREDIEVFIGEE